MASKHPAMIPLITAVSISAAYWASRYRYQSKSWQHKGTLVVAIWAAYLNTIQKDEAALFSQDTMIQSVLVFIIPLKLSQAILAPSPRHDINTDKKKDGKIIDDSKNNIKNKNQEVEEETQSQMSWKDFASFTGSIFYYALPVSKSSPPEPTSNSTSGATLKTLLLKNTEYLLVVFGKLIILPVVDAWSRQLVASNIDDPMWHTTTTTTTNDHRITSVAKLYLTSLYCWKLLALFSCGIIAGTWITDLQCILVNVLSLGRFEMLPMNNYPGWAISVGELWSKRYNLLIHALLKETVYVPLRKTLHCNATVASLAAFGVSGILHSWVAYFTFGRGVLRACVFFLIQVPWIVLENRVLYNHLTATSSSTQQQKRLSLHVKMLRRVVTLTVFFASLPIYAGLFVECLPQWLDKNDPSVPKLLVLWDLSLWLMKRLHIGKEYLR